MSATRLSRASMDSSYWTGRVLPSGLDGALLDRLQAQAAVGDGSRELTPVHIPFTGETLGWLRRGLPADINRAVAEARSAQRAWGADSVRKRAAVLQRFASLLLVHQEQGLDLIQLESGKARRHALEEIIDTIVVSRYYAAHASAYLRPRRRAASLPVITTAMEYRRPVGVVGVVSPWNFPLILSITDALAALVAGNGVVLRPDEQGSFTALWAAELLCQAGLPAGVLRIVTGEGPVLGPALVDAADFVMFTGSTRTGRIVATQAAERLIGFSLELGGKNPMLVLADANVESAAEGLSRGAFVGAGQVCVSIERVYIHASIFEEFVERFVARVRGLTMSPALAYGADMGSLTLPSQIERVEAHVADAVGKGATLLAGGKRRPDLGPLFYEPTVLAGVSPQMRAYAEETFGPVVALYPFTSIDEAVARANDSPYGLNASVWSRNIVQATEVAGRIQCGSVNVNDCYAGTWSATSSPVGGMKQSGFGRRHGAEGILKYTEAQTVTVQRWIPLAPPRFMKEATYSRWAARIVNFLGRIRGGIN